MSWTERQRHMLAEMGLRVWTPAPGAAADAQAEPAGAGRATAPEPRTARDSGAQRAPAVGAGATAGARADAEAITAVEPQPRERAGAAAARPPTAAPTQRREAASPPTAGATAARPDAATIATLDWPALRDAVAACRACGLCGSRRQTVFGVGHERAHLMVVGEAPGEQEDRQGEPFVGAAGHLLDRMLAALGLGRAADAPERQVYIANTLKCRPPGNRNPEPEELRQCEPFLQRQLALVQPRAILAMGRFAVQALLRSDEPIGRLRGRVHTYEGVPLVVTYHPAYLLRNPADKAKAWDDLCLAASVLASPGTA
jgi:DNA polymerase